MKDFIKRVLMRLGYELIRARPHIVDILLLYNIDVVFDVGANVGQFAEMLRADGYEGRIVSFEPLEDPYERLHRKAVHDKKWTALNVGLGSTQGTGAIHVARFTEFSSLLKPLPRLEEFAGEKLATVATQEIRLETVDSQFDKYVHPNERAFLKLDTQGYERHIIAGAASSLSKITGIQLELSLSQLYSGESTLVEMLALLDRSGFSPILIEPVVYDRAKGSLLQIDCIFVKRGESS